MKLAKSFSVAARTHAHKCQKEAETKDEKGELISESFVIIFCHLISLGT